MATELGRDTVVDGRHLKRRNARGRVPVPAESEPLKPTFSPLTALARGETSAAYTDELSVVKRGAGSQRPASSGRSRERRRPRVARSLAPTGVRPRRPARARRIRLAPLDPPCDQGGGHRVASVPAAPHGQSRLIDGFDDEERGPGQPPSRTVPSGNAPHADPEHLRPGCVPVRRQVTGRERVHRLPVLQVCQMDVLAQGLNVAEDGLSGLDALSHAHGRLDVPVLERPAVSRRRRLRARPAPA